MSLQHIKGDYEKIIIYEDAKTRYQIFKKKGDTVYKIVEYTYDLPLRNGFTLQSVDFLSENAYQIWETEYLKVNTENKTSNKLSFHKYIAEEMKKDFYCQNPYTTNIFSQ